MKEKYYSSLGAALADRSYPRAPDFGAVDQGSYKYGAGDYVPEDQVYGPAVPTEIIRAQAEEAEAQYDKTMQTRREAEAAEAQYDKAQSDSSKKIAQAVIITAVVIFALWWISTRSGSVETEEAVAA